MSSKLQYKAAPSASEVPTEVLHEGFTHNEVSTEPEAIPQAPEITIEGGEDIQAAEVSVHNFLVLIFLCE
jgi:hypothetical protein